MLGDAQRKELAAKLPPGASVKFGEKRSNRTYGLVEGGAALEPAQAVETLQSARWYDEAIIALAIEPTPADALPAIRNALFGAGGPAGVLECDVVSGAAIVEFAPSRILPSLVLNVADVELRRYRGTRIVNLLNPLPAAVMAQIASDGLHAAEITPERILETLLERPGAE
jgi:hypothetical protein